jgi:pSer/pThr/pTyr-binding forkhead associated (FHA) protein
MGPTPNRSPDASAEPQRPVLGELVVHNGRLAGVRRSLTTRPILIGQGEHCDIRLNVEEVEPLHCLLFHTLEGFRIRDLGSAAGTFVNGAAVAEQLLTSSDRLSIGPFQFSVEAHGEAHPTVTQAQLEAERDALRVQAAAVVAQQAALGEEESRLRQQRIALRKEKEQLAGHLEARRQALLEMQEQVRQDRNAFATECETIRKEHEHYRARLQQEQADLVAAQKRADQERLRCVELRKRLKRRWRRHWAVQERVLADREKELAQGWNRLQRESETVQRDRAALVQAQLRFNGEAELGRRQLQDEWQQLGLAQQHWEAVLNQEQARRERQRQELEARAVTVAAAERAVSDQQRRLEQRRVHLTLELQGLDVRARNQRQKLFEQEQRLARLALLLPTHAEAETETVPDGAQSTALVAAAIPIRPVEVPAVWTRLAGGLADQRQHLLEQWQNFLSVEEAWQAGKDTTLAAVEAYVRSLEERERRLIAHEEAISAHEQAVASATEEVRRRQQALAEVRCALEGWQARLTIRETAWHAERVAQEAQMRAREEGAAAAIERVEQLQERQHQRRTEEIELARLARERFDELRQNYAGLWQECQERRAELASEQRSLTTRAVALEHLRLDLQGRSRDPVNLSRRLKRLQKKYAAAVRGEEHALAEERRRVVAETQRLEERSRQLALEQQALAARTEEVARQVTAWEEHRRSTAEAQEQRCRELEVLRRLHAEDEKQIAQLREELESVAVLLLDEGVAPLPANQAA